MTWKSITTASLSTIRPITWLSRWASGWWRLRQADGLPPNPQDFTAQAISGLLYKLTRQFGDNPSKLHEALNFTVEQGPAKNPILTVPSKWLEYSTGKNPTDDFRDRPILNRTGEGIRGIEGAKQMMTWSMNTMGAKDYFSIFTNRNNDDLGVVGQFVTGAPLLNRFIKISLITVIKKNSGPSSQPRSGLPLFIRAGTLTALKMLCGHIIT